MTTVGMNTYKKAYPVGYPTKSQDLFILFFLFYFILFLALFMEPVTHVKGRVHMQDSRLRHYQINEYLTKQYLDNLPK